MILPKLVTEKFILLNQKSNSKKNVLELISSYLQKEIKIKKDTVFENLYLLYANTDANVSRRYESLHFLKSSSYRPKSVICHTRYDPLMYL